MKSRFFIPSILTALVAILSPSTIHALDVAKEGAEVGQWTMDWDKAKALAKEKNLPMLLNFTGSDWCGWCKLMDKAVYDQDAWKKYASENLVLVTIDFPRDKGIVPAQFTKRNNDLKNEFSVRGYPTYILLESDASTKLGQLGAGRDKTPETFIKEVESVLRFRQASIDAKVKDLGEEKGAAYLEAIESLKKAEGELKDWIGTGPERNEENNRKYGELMGAIEAAGEKVDSF